MAQNTARSGGSATNDYTTRHAGHALGRRERKRTAAFEKAEEPITASEVAKEMDLNAQPVYNSLDRPA